MKHPSFLKRIYRDIHQQKASLLPVTLLSSITGALSPYVYMIGTAIIIDGLLSGSNLQQLVFIVLGIVAVQAAVSSLNYYLSNLHLENTDWISMREKNQLTQKLLEVDYESLISKEFSEMVARHRGMTGRRGGIYAQCLWALQGNLTSFLSVMAGIVAAWQLWPLLFQQTGKNFAETPWFTLLVVIATLSACWLLYKICGKISQGNTALEKKYAQSERMYNYYRDMVSDYNTGKEIRLFSQQAFIHRIASEEMLSKGAQCQKQISNRSALSNGLSALFKAIIALGAYLIVCVRVQNGTISLGNMMMYIGSLLKIIDGCTNLSKNLGSYRGLDAKAQLYFDILDYQFPIAAPTRPAHAAATRSRLECKSLCYRYPDSERYAVENIELTLEPGEKLAIVGENGSGKTTFIKLLCGLLTPTSGEILLDNTVVSAFDKADYQNHFSVVFQDHHIFSLPLGENVACSETYDADRVRNALREARYGGTQDLSVPLYRDCSPNGIDPSGGEAQKVALARALYKDASIMVLDEPTSAMDPFAEFELYARFNEMIGDKSAIFISHRLSSCVFCDRIAVFDQGHLVQLGRHKKLIEDKAGKYYQLWTAQAQYYT
jgi:ATP-binding cassette subfamily B protein